MAENEVIDETPKTKDEMRHEPHEFKDNNGWCAVCGRSAGWKAHGVVAEIATAPIEVGSEATEPEDEDSIPE